MKGWTPSKLPSRLKRDDVATPQSSWQRLALMWQKCGIALKRLVNVRVNRSLSDLTDQTNRCLADTVNSLHRCQAQVTAGAEKKPLLIPIDPAKIKPNKSIVEIYIYAEKKETPCSRTSPPRQDRYSFTGSNEYMKVNHCHPSCACGVSPPNSTTGPLFCLCAMRAAQSHTRWFVCDSVFSFQPVCCGLRAKLTLMKYFPCWP